MKIEQISKNSYRVKKQIHGNRYSLIFDHKPSEKEITLKLSDLYNQDGFNGQKRGTLGKAMREYISVKDNILSPSTIRGYNQLMKMYPEWILDTNLYDLTQSTIQKAVNEYALDHSPKSTMNYSSFLLTVLKMYRPEYRPVISLPKVKQPETILPTEEQVLQIIKYFEGSEYHVPIQLACLGLRRSEICALTLSDLDGNILRINKGAVFDKNQNVVVKDMPKTLASIRQIYLPDALANEIREKGCIYRYKPNAINNALHRAQKALNIPLFRLHDLRHFYVSYAHANGMTDVDIMKAAGYGSDRIMKRTYRHSMDTENAEQKRIANSIFFNSK